MSGRIPRYRFDKRANMLEIPSHKHYQSAPKRENSEHSILRGRGMEDEAEATLLAVLEERRAKANRSGDIIEGWKDSVEGERPPLEKVPMQQTAGLLPEEDEPLQAQREDEEGEKEKRWFSNLARRARVLSRQGHLTPDDLDEGRKEKDDVFLGVGAEKALGADKTDADRLITGALAIDELFKENEETESIVTEGSEESWDAPVDEESMPLTATTAAEPTVRTGYQSTPELVGRRKKKRRKARRRRIKRCLKTIFCMQGKNRLLEVLHPRILLVGLFNFLFRSMFTFLGLPCLIAAYILYYQMGNPILDFMSQATVSWFLIFATRQILTLHLALFSQYLLVEAIAMRSRLAVKLIGPLVTLFLINAKGWPLIATFWSIWNLFIMHGDNKFQRNWLFFTGIEMFSKANYGGHIIESSLYLRCLIALLFAGTVTAVKREFVALYFGKKTFANYKARLEKLLADIVLIAEVAELSSHVESSAQEAKSSQQPVKVVMSQELKRGGLTDTKWTSVKFQETIEPSPSSPDVSPSAEGDSGRKMMPRDIVDEDLTSDDDDDSAADEEDVEEEDEGESDEAVGEEPIITGSREPQVTFKTTSERVRKSVPSVASRSVGSTRRIKNLLERWTEPVTKDEKTEVSISDILKFRKALTFMDDTHPFSTSFGPAQTRDECIRSAQRTYRRLMMYQKGQGVLSFDVINLLSSGPDSVSKDQAKEAALRVLFRPDRFDEISLLAFVQACDTVYKRLRFFRASVGNSSVIDQVLENMIDGVFGFILFLTVLFILKFNPWPLLVSFSTLIVSFAFAFGSSASKYIEGVLMIILRRPFDLGDRIIIVGNEQVANYDTSFSWFVEDLNLFSTTLRFGATNHVATVNNGSIAQSRIVNCARSVNAIVTLTFRLGLSTPLEQIEIFREAIDKFVQDNPRIWDTVLFFLCDQIDPDMDLMVYSLRVRHTKPWQDAPVINASRSELDRFCYELGNKLGIMYDTPARTQVVVLEDPPEQSGGRAITRAQSRTSSGLPDDVPASSVGAAATT